MGAQRKFVLVVDDEADLRALLTEIFEMEGHATCAAANAREALRHCAARPFDLIVSDIRMPGGDGLELLAGLKTTASQAAPVVLMSGYTDVSQEAAVAMGASAMVHKPFLPRELLEKTRRFLAS